MSRYTPQQTLQYIFFIKRAVLESLQAAFADHPDATVRQARLALDFSSDRWRLPGVIIKYYERNIDNIGVGHVEYLPSPDDPDPDNPSIFIEYHHRLYHGDIAFEVWGNTSVDRDLVRDALIEVLGMQEVTPSGENFINRLYNSLTTTPYGLWHFPVLNLDKITGYGEQVTIAPWRPEDVLVYQASYRVPIVGEFYSTTPTSPSTYGVLEEVDVYPWIVGLDPSPVDNPDGPDAPGWYHFTGWPVGETQI